MTAAASHARAERALLASIALGTNRPDPQAALEADERAEALFKAAKHTFDRTPATEWPNGSLTDMAAEVVGAVAAAHPWLSEEALGKLRSNWKFQMR